MNVLVAEDEAVAREILVRMLSEWGFDVKTVEDGTAAWRMLQGPDAPPLAILDWMMPGLDGIDVVRRARGVEAPDPPYLILVTARDATGDTVEGLEAGANDYVVKPFEEAELRARVQVGARMVRLQRELTQRVADLEAALGHVKKLQGLLPICSYCKKIRDDRNYWHGVETYISASSDVLFSHSVCPDCYESVVRPELEDLKRRRRHS